MSEYPGVEGFVKRLGYALDPFQRVACELLEQGSSVLVAAPTGSGKTTVAEFAVHLARRERDERVFYTTPIKALSNQKFNELAADLGADQVGLLTGDTNINGDAPVVVMTTEVLRNMIYDNPARLDNLAFVVLDEVHYLGDKFRGATWEEIILYLPKHVRLVGLSATVSNIEEMGDWIHAVRGDTEVVISEKRPVPLYHHVLTRSDLLPLYLGRDGKIAAHGKINPELFRLSEPRVRSRGRAPVKRDRGRVSRSMIAQVLDEVELLPAIVFIFSRAGCDEAVQQCCYGGLTLTNKEERQEILEITSEVVKGFTPAEQSVLRLRQWQDALQRGIASHHAGLLPVMKAAVEKLFQRRLVKLVFATETLALGLNMPAKAVVIESLEKFNGQARVPLTSGEFTQLTGRAGRRGLDTEGHAIVVWQHGLDPTAAAQLAGTRSFPVFSSFKPTFNMVVNLLTHESVPRVRKTLERSFAQFQTDRTLVSDAAELQDLRRSLQGYDKAVGKSKSHADAQRWKKRAAKIRKQCDALERKIGLSSGGLARQFDRILDVLLEFGYIEQADESGDHLLPITWGLFLKRIYGEQSLLVTEGVRRGIWDNLSAPELAGIAATITFEHRRGVEMAGGFIPGDAWESALDNTLDLWDEIYDKLRAYRIPTPGLIDAALAPTVFNWARGLAISDVLKQGNLSAGDFVRCAKQATDLLDQIADACRATADINGLDDAERDRLQRLRKTARRASAMVTRDIVDTAEQDDSLQTEANAGGKSSAETDADVKDSSSAHDNFETGTHADAD